MRQTTTTDRPAKKSPIKQDREDREAFAGDDDDIMDDELDELQLDELEDDFEDEADGDES